MAEKVLMTGNESAAEGAIRAGCDCYYGYPITPQNEFIAYMAQHMPEQGRVFLQAESELGAINMVYGSAAAGQRAMTSSSSPGISLKQEGISYLAGAQLPAVIVNVQRGGPGLGNIAPSQSDYFQATRGGGHGDYRTIVLAPASVQENFDFTALAFELADKYRGPVVVLTDGLIGQMMEPMELREVYSEPPPKPWALTGCKGRQANLVKSLYLKPPEMAVMNERFQEKYRRIAAEEVRVEEIGSDRPDLVLVAYGTSARVCQDAMVHGVGDYQLRLVRPQTLWPFPSEAVGAWATGVPFLVVEMSAGQLVEDVRLAVEGRSQVHLLGKLGGLVPSWQEVAERIQSILRGTR